VQRFQGELVSEAHKLCASLNARLESNKEEEEVTRTLLMRTTPEKSASEWPNPMINPYVRIRCHTCHPPPLSI